MKQNQLVIKGTILGLTFDSWVNDMAMFVSTALMVVENWADVTFTFSQEFREIITNEIAYSSLERE